MKNPFLKLTAEIRKTGQTLQYYQSDCINETEAVNILQELKMKGYNIKGAWLDGIWFERFFEEFNSAVR